MLSLPLLACRQPSITSPPLVAQLSGTIEVPGIVAPVRVIRDRWGVPHIHADNRDDLFIAQGLVQAQDRLFQMDLWRRAAQGRLAEVLGANFVDRDVMTRRVQYRGDPEVEWASYGPDAQAIAASFVRGINAWVSRAREHPPEEFIVAGWKPDFWSPADLLNRTDAFIAVRKERAIDQATAWPDVVADGIRSVGSAPFFVGSSRLPAPAAPASPCVVSADPHTGLTINEQVQSFEVPSPRYLVDLHAPGWHVAGLTSPWAPGVSVGHSEQFAWGVSPAAGTHIDDLVVGHETAQTGSTSRGHAFEAVRIKGRRVPMFFAAESTPHGIVIASDKAHGEVITLSWSGLAPGAAPALAALAIDRARDWSELRAAVDGWKVPAQVFVLMDTHGKSSTVGGSTPSASATAVDANAQPRSEQVMFGHVLATTAARRQRFDVGPIVRPSGGDCPVRLVLDPADWDRSRAMNAVGQSESPSSPHFADLVGLWSAGEMIPLWFGDDRVRAAAEATLRVVGVSSQETEVRILRFR